ncbi:LicD family protein [Candidatus Saccharibacteria bacterium]|nr:LicD family protein [Candidatus Saccharibacteria bacterium]
MIDNKEITLNEYKKRLINILLYLDRTCRDNDIKYSLFGGSMIGAVRNGGIIPWDDDIDIVFDQNNYKKLIHVLKNKENKHFKLLTPETEETYYYPYAKLVDLNTDVEEIGCKKINNYGVYIDLFCFHNAPRTKIGRSLHFYKIQYYKILFSGYAHKTIKNTYKYAKLKKIGKIYAEKIGIQKVIKKYNKLIQKYDKKQTKYMIIDWPVYGPSKDYQQSKNTKKYMKIIFENNSISIFKNYDAILRQTFDDYMKLPPIEQRVAKHNMKAYIKK